MRRGIGLVDIFLYVFLLFLIIFSLVLTGIPAFKSNNVQISDTAGYLLIRSSIVERSLLESFRLTVARGESPAPAGASEGTNYEDFSVTRSESLSMIATYKDSSVLRGKVPGRYLYSPFATEPALLKNDIHFSVIVSEHDRIATTIPRLTTSADMNFWIYDEGTALFSAGVQRGSQDPESRLIRVPGYIGPVIHAKSVFIMFKMPAEVKSRES